MPPDEQQTTDRRLWLIPLGLAVLVVAAAVVVYGPRLRGEAGAPLESIPPFAGTPESGGFLSDRLPEPGQPAPEFELPDLDGNTVALSDFRGQTVILNFWATWCAPCRIEMPELERVSADYADEGVVVLTINQEETAEQVRDFLDEVGLSLPALLDGDGAVGAAYGAFFLPSTVIVDGDGVVSAYHRGIISREEIDGYIASDD